MLNNLFPSLKVRILDIEMMEKSIDVRKVINTVKQFKYTNLFFSRSRYLLKRFIVKDMIQQANPSYTFLDVGAGGCDLARWLARLCRRMQVDIRITCLEQDQRIADYAKNACCMYPEIQVLQGEVKNLPQMGRFDYIFSNHFLHNFSETDLTQLLEKVLAHTNNVLLMNDLYRSWFSYWGFYLFSVLLLRHSFATVDGLMSIRKGFLIEEMEEIIKAMRYPAQLSIKKYLPGRLVVIGRKYQKRKDTE